MAHGKPASERSRPKGNAVEKPPAPIPGFGNTFELMRLGFGQINISTGPLFARMSGPSRVGDDLHFVVEVASPTHDFTIRRNASKVPTCQKWWKSDDGKAKMRKVMELYLTGLDRPQRFTITGNGALVPNTLAKLDEIV